MLVKIILTALLIICAFWAAVHFTEKQRLERIADAELREKYKNNYDSVFLSDITYYRRGQLVTDTNFLPKSNMLADSGKVVEIGLYDNTFWKIKLPKEKINFEAYLETEDYLERFSKSAVHVSSYTTNRHNHYKTITVYNNDTLSNINNIVITFFRGQLSKLKIYYKK